MTPPDHVGDDPVPHAGGGSQGLGTARLTGLLNGTYVRLAQHKSLTPATTPGQYSSGRIVCGVDAASGRLWSYNSSGFYQVDSLTATNWSSKTLPTNCTMTSAAAKAVVFNGLMYAIFLNSVSTFWEVYSAPLVSGSTQPTWTGPLLQLSANASLIPTAFRATSRGLYVGEYCGSTNISPGPTLWRTTDGTNFTAVLGPLASNYPTSGYRHFHGVYEDPYATGTIYATVGDQNSPNMMFKSTDGATFTGVSAVAGNNSWQAVALGFSSDWIWGCSDQGLGFGPWVMDRATLTPKWATFDPMPHRQPVPGGLPARVATDLALTSGSTTVTSAASASFASTDVGRYVNGNNSIPVGAYIASVTNSTTAVLSVAATSTASSQTATIEGDRFYAGAYMGAVDPATGYLYFVACDTSVAGTVGGLFVIPGPDQPPSLLYVLRGFTGIGAAELFIGGGYLWIHRLGPVPLLTA